MKTFNMLNFDIGDWVRFTHIVESEYDKNSKKILKSIKLNESAIGRIVGMTIKYEGKYSHSANAYNPLYEDYQPYLKNAKGTWLWLVRTGMTNRPYLVRDEHIRFMLSAVKEFPFRNRRRLK